MSTHIFSGEQLNELRKNPYVEKCSERSITFTYDFKKHALEQYAQGVSSKEIWRSAGFDTRTWRRGYEKACIHSWRKIVKKKGTEGLAEARGSKTTGRGKTKGVTD